MNVIVIGCGLAGLGAIWSLKNKNINFVAFEKESRPGGLCRTEKQNQFLFDYTGHLLHFRDKMFSEIVFSKMSDKLDQRKRNAWIYSQKTYTRYPFQANLYGLPIDTVVECIYEYGRQHFNVNKKDYTDFEDWIYSNYGSGIAKHFMIPYNKKIYKTNPGELAWDCAGRFLPQSDLKLLLKGALVSNSSELGYNATFHYPVIGGIETLVDALANGIDIRCNENVETIDIPSSTVITNKGNAIQFDYIIATQPLPELVNSVRGDINECKHLAKELNYVSVLNINIGLKGNLDDKHWVYIPEEKYDFHRIGFPHNFSKAMAPQGHSSIYIEVSYKASQKINKNSIVEKSINDLVDIGIVSRRDDIVAVKILDIPFGYVIFDKKRDSIVTQIHRIMENKQIICAGRFGSWEYQSMEDSFMDGYRKTEKILQKACV